MYIFGYNFGSIEGTQLYDTSKWTSEPNKFGIENALCLQNDSNYVKISDLWEANVDDILQRCLTDIRSKEMTKGVKVSR